MIGICTVARASEYLRRPGKHHYRAQDVVFTVVEGNKPVIYVPSMHVHRHKKEDVTGMTFTLVDCKNDVERIGHALPFERNNSPDCAFDFVGECYEWAGFARPKENKPFLSTQDGWELSYDKFNSAIKEVATAFGLDATRYSTHSMRIGGASILAAAGVPDYIIQLAGRWKSLAFLQYIRLADIAYKKAINALTNKDLLTVDHLRKIVPGINVNRLQVAAR